MLLIHTTGTEILYLFGIYFHTKFSTTYCKLLFMKFQNNNTHLNGLKII